MSKENIQKVREPSKRVFKDYDPSWLVKLAEEQYPNDKWIVEAFKNCTKCSVRSKLYTYFAPRPNKFKPNKEMKSKAIMLDGGDNIGLLYCDLDSEQCCIFGIEFLTILLEDHHYDYREWGYTKRKQEAKEWMEELEYRKTGRDEFFGCVNKSGGSRSSRNAPKN